MGTSPWRIAVETASVRDSAFSLAMIWRTWNLAVLALTFNCAAMALFPRPAAISCSTSNSRAVRVSGSAADLSSIDARRNVRRACCRVSRVNPAAAAPSAAPISSILAPAGSHARNVSSNGASSSAALPMPTTGLPRNGRRRSGTPAAKMTSARSISEISKRSSSSSNAASASARSLTSATIKTRIKRPFFRSARKQDSQSRAGPQKCRRDKTQAAISRQRHCRWHRSNHPDARTSCRLPKSECRPA